MNVYFSFEQTPELQSLPSQENRHAVHSSAWKTFVADHPNLGLRGLAFVVLGIACAWVIGVFVVRVFQPGIAGVAWPMPLIGSLGGGMGAFIHLHFVTAALGKCYRDIVDDDALRMTTSNNSL